MRAGLNGPEFLITWEGQPEILNAFTLYEMFENAGGDSAALAEVIAQVEGVE